MTDLDTSELRRQKWHLDGRPVRTLEDARSFLSSTGFCLMYPQKPPVLVPTFIGAWIGSEDRLPTQTQAFADSRAQDATELMVRLLRDRSAFEANLFGESNPLLIAASIFPYFYALVGERNPRQPPVSGPRSEYSNLACDTFAAIQRGGPISKVQLQETLGGSISTPALDHALAELGAKLRITRVDFTPANGSVWDVLYRWSPDAVREGIEISVASAITALTSKYIDCVIAAEPQELDAFLGNFVSRSRVREAVNALLAMREFEFIRLGSRTLIRATPPKVEFTKSEYVKPVINTSEIKKSEFKPAGLKRPEVRRFAFKNSPASKNEISADAGATNEIALPGLGSLEEAIPSEQVASTEPELDLPSSQGADAKTPEVQKIAEHSPAPDVKKTEFKKSGFKQPGFKKTGFKSDHKKSGFGKPGFRKPDFGKSGFGKPDFKRPDFKGSRPDGGDAKQPESARPAFQRSEFKRPSGGRPDFKTPDFRKPGPGRPDFKRSESGRSSFAKSGFSRPGFQKPGSEKPRSDRPGSERPRSERPDFRKTDSRRPDFNRPAFGKPRAAASEFRKPEFKKFDSRKPDFKRPDSARPAFGKPGFKRPFGKSDSSRPASGRPSFGKPAFKKFGFKKPEFDKPDSGPSESRKPSFERSEFGKPEFKRTGPPKTGFKKFGGKPGFKKSDAKRSSFGKPGFKKGGVRKDGPRGSSSRPSGSRPSRGGSRPPKKG